MEKRMMFNLSDAKLRAEEKEEEGKKKRIIRGYPILFNSPTKIGNWTEIIRPGALDGVDLSNLYLLGYHMSSMPFARNGINMRTEVDNNGLFIEVELGDTHEDDVLYDRVSKGIVNGMSFAFISEEVTTNFETKTDEILKFKEIWEVSIVTFPAYKDAIAVAYERDESKEINKDNKNYINSLLLI